MSRYSRFDRERINKLFGRKTKIIKKPIEERSFSFLGTPDSKQNVVPFNSANYITMENYDRRKRYKQSLRFRCYQDEDVFGTEIFDQLKLK